MRKAYINVMSEAALVPTFMVDVQMSSQELGYIKVTYILTIPYSGDAPSVSLSSLEDRLSTLDIPTFDSMLRAEMSKVAPGFQQKVISVVVDAWQGT